MSGPVPVEGKDFNVSQRAFATFFIAVVIICYS